MKKILHFFLSHKWHRVIRKVETGRVGAIVIDMHKCLRCPEWKVDIKQC